MALHFYMYCNTPACYLNCIYLNTGVINMKYQRTNSFVTRQYGKVILLVPASGECEAVLTLNHTGAEIWNLLENPISLSALNDKLAEMFPDQETLDGDIQLFISELKDANLIKEVS